MRPLFLFVFLFFSGFFVRAEMPACGEANFRGALEKEALADLQFIVKNCRHQNLNLQARIQDPDTGERLMGGILHLSIFRGWDPFLGELLEIPELNKKLLDGQGRNLLTLAVVKSNPQATALILRFPWFDVNQEVNNHGGKDPLLITALRIAITTKKKSDSLAVFETLLADPRINVNVIGFQKMGLLHYLIESPQIGDQGFRKKIFLDARFNKNIKNELGETPIQTAFKVLLLSQSNGDAVFLELMSWGIYDVNDISQGPSLLQMAVQYGSLSRAKLLIETFGANVNVPMLGAKSILELLLSAKNRDLVQYIIALPSLNVMNQSDLLVSSALLNNWFFYKNLAARMDSVFAKDQFAVRFLTEIFKAKNNLDPKEQMAVVRHLLSQPNQDWLALDAEGMNLVARVIARAADEELATSVWNKLSTLSWDVNQQLGPEKTTVLQRLLVARARSSPSVLNMIFQTLLKVPTLNPMKVASSQKSSLWLIAIKDFRDLSFAHGLEGHPNFDWNKIGDVNSSGYQGTALNVAIEAKDVNLVERLLKFPSLNPNLGKSEGALLQSLKRVLEYQSSEDWRIFDLLFNDTRSDKNGLADANLGDETHCPALILAAKKNNTLLFDRLWSLGVQNPNARGCGKIDRNDTLVGASAFEYAVINNNLAMEEKLRPLLKLNEEEQNSAWKLFLINQNTKGMLQFWNAGFRPDLNIRGSKKGPTALALAFWMGDQKLINAIDPEGKLPWTLDFQIGQKLEFKDLPSVLAWTRNLSLTSQILQDPRWNSVIISNAIKNLFNHVEAASESSNLVQLSRILVKHPKFKIEDLIGDRQFDVIYAATVYQKERKGKPLSLAALLPFFENPQFDVSGPYHFRNIYLMGSDAVTALMNHPSFDPNNIDYSDTKGGIFVETKDRIHFNSWIRHPKTNIQNASRRYIEAIGILGWSDEVLWLQANNSIWNEETLRAWTSIYKVNSAEGEAYIGRMLTMKGAPPIKSLSWLLTEVAKARQAQLLRHLLSQYSGWDLNTNNAALGTELIKMGLNEVLEDLLKRSDFLTEIYEGSPRNSYLSVSLLLNAVEGGNITAYRLIRKWRADQPLKFWQRIAIAAAESEPLNEAEKHEVILEQLLGRDDLTGLSYYLFLPAIENSWFDIIDLLLSFDLNIYGHELPKTTDRQHFYISLCEKGRLEVLKHINSRTLFWINLKSDRTTALIAATKARQVEVVRHLLQQPGIEKNLADENGMTALDWAATRGYQEIVKLLQ